MKIYHITTNSEWATAQENGCYTPVNFGTDGFIHCSFKEQVLPVADRYYRNAANLVLLEIETSLLDARVAEENLEGGLENFPHIYGALPAKAVTRFAPLIRDSNGNFVFPVQLA